MLIVSYVAYWRILLHTKCRESDESKLTLFDTRKYRLWKRGQNFKKLKCQSKITEQLITLCSHTFNQNEPVKTEGDNFNKWLLISWLKFLLRAKLGNNGNNIFSTYCSDLIVTEPRELATGNFIYIVWSRWFNNSINLFFYLTPFCCLSRLSHHLWATSLFSYILQIKTAITVALREYAMLVIMYESLPFILVWSYKLNNPP